MTPEDEQQRLGHEELVHEQATNERYLKELTEFLRRPVEYGLPRNEVMVGNLRSGKSYDIMHPLIGRVGLDCIDELAGRTFYIGPRYIERDGLLVYSWAAPVAKVFFQPDLSDHDLSPHVIVRRTLSSRLDQIVRIDDEWVAGLVLEGDSPFALPRGLHVPSAPAAPRAARRPRNSASESPEPRGPRRGETQPPSDRVPSHVEAAPLTDGMRARDAVIHALEAPRSAALTSVLATLQPDQYDIVTRTPDQPLVVQGHPGTGKTIIGVHRAAYLVDPERRENRLSRVLLLGPTPEHTAHVTGIARDLDPEQRIAVRDLPTWLMEIAGLRQQPSGPLDGLSAEAEWFIRGLAQRAAEVLVARGGTNRLRAVYEFLRGNGTPESPLTTKEHEVAWLRSLRPFDQAALQRKYLPLLAQCGLAILGRPALEARFDHVIVDEAQDLTRLEWRIVDAFNRGGRWTLLGDMNQRRTDHTYISWADLGADLGLDDGLNEIEPVVVRRGYRSSQQILDFANRLLPKAERDMRSIQGEGAEVRVTRSTRSGTSLAQLAVSEAFRLIDAYADGTVAVIAMDLGDIIQTLHAEGWRREPAVYDTWSSGDRRLALRSPVTARGVEFDAVVVVEPAAFPVNLARSGPLYTSMTRANRELAVVYHKPLPDALAKKTR